MHTPIRTAGLSCLGLLLTAGLAAQDLAPLLGYRLGQTYRYSYKTISNATMTGRQSTKQGTSELQVQSLETQKTGAFSQEVWADLRVQPVFTDRSDNVLLQLVVLRAGVQGRTDQGATSAALDPEYLLRLQRPIYFLQNRSGAIVRLYREADELTEITNFKRGLISAFQTRIRNEATKDESEQDALGEVRPAYASVSRTAVGDFVVKKTWSAASYIQPVTASASARPMTTDDAILSGSQVTTLRSSDGLIGMVEATVAVDTLRGAAPPSDAFEGFDTRTEALATGILTLREVTNERLPAVPDLSTWVATSLAMERVFDAEIALSEPDRALTASEEGQLLERLRGNVRFAQAVANRIGDARAPLMERQLLAGLLAQEGSEQAQELLVASILHNESLPPSVRERALVSLVTVERPTLRTVEALAGLTEHEQTDLRRGALVALGAAIEKYHAIEPSEVSRHLDVLHQYLSRPLSEAEQIAVIAAIGNAGQASSVAALAPFLQHPSTALRWEAVDALRKMKDDRALQVLLEQAAEDSHPAIRAKALDMVRTQVPVRSVVTAAAVLLDRSWEKVLGNGDVKASLNGTFKVTEAPFHLEGKAGITGYAFGLSKNLIQAVATGDVTGSANAQSLTLNGGLYILNNKVWNYSDSIQCSIAREKQWGSSFNFFTVSTTIPIWGPLTLDLFAGMNGSASFKARAALNGCTTSPFASATVTPSAGIGAYASAALSLVVVRGGLTFDVQLVRGEMPSLVSGQLRIPGGFQARADVDVVLQPLTMDLSVWYQFRKFKPFYFYWGGGDSLSLWRWSLPATTYHIYTLAIPN